MSYADQLVAEILRTQGLPAPQAQALAEALVSGLVAGNLILQAQLDAWNTDARIYDLRGQRLTALQISERVGQTQRHVYRAVRRHQARRRAALRGIA